MNCDAFPFGLNIFYSKEKEWVWHKARHYPLHFSFIVDSEDDRRIGHRSLALKFEDHDKESPLDLILQTGNISAIFNAEVMEERVQAFSKGGEFVKRHLLSLPIK